MTRLDRSIAIAKTHRHATPFFLHPTIRRNAVLFLALLFLTAFFLPPTVSAQPPATGPWVIEVVPSGGASAPFDLLQIRFNDVVTGFTVDDVTVTGPGGPITPLGLTFDGSTYELDLTGLTGLSTYTLTIGPADIQDSQAASMQRAYEAVLFGGNASISAADASYDGKSLVIQNATVTIDGSHGFESIDLRGGGILNHSAATEATVFDLDMVIDDYLQIDADSAIDVSGRGYLAGRTNGNINYDETSANQCGGSYGGLGYEVAGQGLPNPVYGEYTDPNEPGSGGGDYWTNGGGSGGGLVRITVDTAVIDGAIAANGGNGGFNADTAGSGGGIRLDVIALSGSGTITASGGAPYGSYAGGGSGGRIAVYYDTNSLPLANIQAYGGHASGYRGGGVGSVYLKQTAASGELYIKSDGNNTNAFSPLGLPGQNTFSVERLIISGSETVAVPEHDNLTIEAQEIVIQDQGVLSHRPTTNAEDFGLWINTETLNIASGAAIDVSGRGYLSGRTNGNINYDETAANQCGGSYGGLGYEVAGQGLPNPVYGDYTDPNEPGSGGGDYWTNGGGSGGGLVRIIVDTAVIDGTIAANGGNGGFNADTAGSGGGIRLDVIDLSGSGSITASGGVPYGSYAGGGSGGRIAVYYDTNSLPLANIQAYGGHASGYRGGGVGSVYLKQTAASGELYIKSDGNNTNAFTLLGLPGEDTFSVERLVISGSETIAVPEHNGMLIQAQEIVIENQGVLSHRPATASETFSLLIDTGLLSIEAGGAIDVTGRGYLVGRTSGNTTTGAAEQRNGGSYGGLGYEAAGYGLPNRVYGDYKDPSEPGSGGGPEWVEGGSGGGLVRIAALTAAIDGTIRANGGNGAFGADTAGSGGGIRLDVGTLSGTGTITASGGVPYGSYAGGGGGGRIAVYYDTNALSLDNIQAHGGHASGYRGGGVGSVYLKQTGEMGELHINSHGDNTNSFTPLGLPGVDTFAVERLVISGSETIAVPEHDGLIIEADDIVIQDNGVLSHRPATASDTYSLLIDTETLSVSDLGAIDVTGRGYSAGRTKGNTAAGATQGTASGSYGGFGFGAGSNALYGDPLYPVYPGSGGGLNWSSGGAGGGAVRLVTASVQLDGVIKADGGNGGFNADTAGSGGSLVIDADTISGSGIISANGGNPYGSTAGGGGGGRIAIYVSDASTIPEANITAAEGSASGYRPGQPGTVNILTEPAFRWTEMEAVLFHDTVKLEWIALGIGPTEAYTVNITATGNTAQATIATNQIDAGSIDWDSTLVPDGVYELKAEFWDASFHQVGSATKTCLVNNSVMWHSGSLAGDESWSSEVTHVVEGIVTVPNGVTLTIAPDAVVKFDNGARILVEDSGILNALATEESPIIFTALSDDKAGGDTNMDGNKSIPLPGSWKGFTVLGAGQLNLSEFVDLRYILTEHSGTLAGSETWQATFAHHIKGSVTVPAGFTLTIQPGAVIKVDAGQKLLVQSGGTLTAVGTSSLPIVFTSSKDDTRAGDTNGDGSLSSPAAGDWLGIYLDGGSGVLTYVQVLYGGASTTSSWRSDSSAAVWTLNAASLTMDNCLIKDAFYDGMLIRGGDVTIQNSIITGADRGIVAWVNATAVVHAVNCTFDDNKIGLLWHGGTMDVVNSLVTNSIQAGIDWDWGAIGPVVRHTNVWAPNAPGYANYANSATDLTGTDGNVSVDPHYVNADQGNYRLQFGSPVIDAADGGEAPVADYLGAPRYDDPRTANTGTPTASGAYADMGAFEFVETAASDLDLVVTWVAGPTSATADQEALLRWQVRNIGSGTVSGSWVDRVGLLADVPTRGVASLTATDIVSTATLGPGEAAEFQSKIRVPGGTEGPWRWQVRTNVKGDVFEGIHSTNNRSPLNAPVALSVKSLVLDNPIAGQFAGAGQPEWYKIVQAANQEILVALDAVSETGRSRIYAGYASMPTVNNFDLRSLSTVTPDARIILPAPNAARTIYLLVVPEATGGDLSYTLTAEEAVFALEEIGLSQAGNGGSVTIPLYGSLFDSDMQVELRSSNGGTVIAATSVVVQNSGLAFATFDLTGRAATNYTVVIIRNGVEKVLANGLSVVNGIGGIFEARLFLPQQVRAGRPYQGMVEYANTGDADLPVPLLLLQSIGGNPVWTEGGCQSCGETQIQFLALPTDKPCLGVLSPGDTYTFTFYTQAENSNTGFSLKSKAGDANDSVPWETVTAAIRPENASPAWDSAWERLFSSWGSSYGAFISAMADGADRAREHGLSLVTQKEILHYLIAEAMLNLAGNRIFGTVYLENSNLPVSLAEIVFTHVESMETVSTLTFYDGRFAVLDIPDGIYSLSVSGFAPSPWGVVQIDAGTVIADIEIPVTQMGVLGGLITDADGNQPIENAIIQIVDQGDQQVWETRTDASGTYTIDLPPGTYVVTVITQGYVPLVSQTLVLAEGVNIGVSTSLSPGSGIEGTVFNPDAQPLAGATICAASQQNGAGSCVTSAQDGTYQLRGLSEGLYSIEAGASGFGGVREENVSVSLSGATVLNLTLNTAGSILLSVTDANGGLPIAGANVISNAAGLNESIFTTGEDGTIVIENLSAGNYNFWVSASSYQTRMESLSITAGIESQADVSLSESGVISGVVQDSAGSFLAQIPVVLLYQEMPLFMAWTNDAGEFIFKDLPLGNYALCLSYWGGFALNRQDISITQDQGRAEKTLELTFSRIRGGVFTSEAGNPLEGVPVYLIGNGELLDATVTDESGRYEFWVLEPGTYDIAASRSDLGFAKVTVSDFAVTTGTDVSGQDLYPGNACLNLTIQGADLSPLVAAQVTVKPTGGLEESALTFFSDSEGLVSICHLNQDSYDIWVSDDTHMPSGQTLVLDSDNKNLEITLSQGRSLEGLVTDDTGELVQGAKILMVQDGNAPELVAVTEADGHFETSAMPESLSDIWVVDGIRVPRRYDDVSVSAGGAVLDVTLETEGATLTGQVNDAAGNPLMGITVTAYSDDGVLLLITATGQNGEFTLGPVCTGSLNIRVRHLGFNPVTVPVTVSGSTNLGVINMDSAVTFQPRGETGMFAASDFSAAFDPLTKATRIPGTQIYDTTGVMDAVNWMGNSGNWLLDHTPAMLGGRLEARVGREWAQTLAWLADDTMPPPGRLGVDTNAFRNYYITLYSNYTVQSDGNSCAAMEQAFKNAQASEAGCRLAFEMWQNTLPYVNSMSRNTIAIAHTKGLALALKTSTTLMAWNDGWLQTGDYLKTLVHSTDLNDLQRKQAAAKMIMALNTYIGKPVWEILKGSYAAFKKGDWKAAAPNMDKLVDIFLGWSTAAADELVEQGLAKDFIAILGKDEGTKLAKKFKLGVFAKIKDILGIAKDLHDFYSETRKGIDENVLPAIEMWWKAYNNYYQAVMTHRANTFAVKRAAQSCLDREFQPAPAPPGLVNEASAGSQLVGSIDPNEKYTIGVGTAGFIDPHSTILYVITFENKADATAAAQEVTITDQLDAKLDWSSVQLRGIGFNQVDVTVPSGLQSFDQEGFKVATDPNPVHVRAALDPDSGVMTWVLESVDSVTGGLPLDPLAGFLPPNDDQHRGEGYVSFTARPKPGLNAGDAIRNRASIVFDVNDPILTGEVVNTLDPNAPASRISLLPDSLSSETFTVFWSGDDGTGAGIESYDVFVSVDDAPFVPWLTMTSQTSAAYNGAFGHTYAFYSIASDRLGHEEGIKTVAEARTTLTAPPVDDNGDGDTGGGGGGGGGGCFIGVSGD